jgi:hypothetical protein
VPTSKSFGCDRIWILGKISLEPNSSRKGRHWLKFVVKSKGIDKIFLTSFFALTTNVLNEINMRIIKIDTKIIAP